MPTRSDLQTRLGCSEHVTDRCTDSRDQVDAQRTSRPRGAATMVVSHNDAWLEGNLTAPVGWAVERGRGSVSEALSELGERWFAGHAEGDRQVMRAVFMQSARALRQVQPAGAWTGDAQLRGIGDVTVTGIDILPELEAASSTRRHSRDACPRTIQEGSRPARCVTTVVRDVDAARVLVIGTIPWPHPKVERVVVGAYRERSRGCLRKGRSRGSGHEHCEQDQQSERH